MKKNLLLISLALFFQIPSYVFCAKAPDFQLAPGLAEGEFEYAMAFSLILSDGPIDTPEKVLNAIKQLVRLRRVNKQLNLLLTSYYIAMVLRTAGANVNMVDECGNTALHKAAFNGYADCVKILLATGANINAVNRDGRTAVQKAAKNGHADCVRMLLAVGADVDAVDRDGRTALYLAACRGHADCVELLLAVGAEVNAVDRDGNKALYYAAFYDHTKCVELLLAAGGAIR